MNQLELQQLATERIKDARALLDGGRWAFAYYVAGYAVECALKSCVLARMVYTGYVYQEKWDAREFRTHEFPVLIRLAGLDAELRTAQAASAAAGHDFINFWTVASAWTVDTRYVPRSQAQAEDLYEAITHDPHGF